MSIDVIYEALVMPSIKSESFASHRSISPGLEIGGRHGQAQAIPEIMSSPIRSARNIGSAGIMSKPDVTKVFGRHNSVKAASRVHGLAVYCRCCAEIRSERRYASSCHIAPGKTARDIIRRNEVYL